jgi:ATP-dependent helicase/nuclease subunit A
LTSFKTPTRCNAPSVFIVGDPKQSIYRFRRAEPQVFIAAKEFMLDGLGGELLECDHTRRNSLGVIGAVNAVMGQARDVDGYDGFREHSTASSEPGQVVRLPPIPRATAADTDDSAADSDWRDSLTTPRELPEETLRTLEARQAAAWISQQIKGGLKPQNVMVLSRKRAGLIPLQDELRALHIPAKKPSLSTAAKCWMSWPCSMCWCRRSMTCRWPEPCVRRCSV